MPDNTGITHFFTGLAEALAQGLGVVDTITSNLPRDEDYGLNVWTESSTVYLVIRQDGKYWLRRTAVNEKSTWHALDPEKIEPLPGGSVDWGSWKCTPVTRIDLVDRKGRVLGVLLGEDNYKGEYHRE